VPTGGAELRLDGAADYVVRLPKQIVTGTVRIDGGRNVMVVGGHISMSRSTRKGALIVNDWTQTLHIEGLRIDPGGSRGLQNDGIQVNSRHAGSVAQLQNVRVERVTGSVGGHHGDILQTWGGPTKLKVDRFTGFTDYQGFYLAPGHFDWHPPLQPWVFSRIDLHMVERTGYALFVLSGQGDDPPRPAPCVDVWADTGPAGKWSHQAKQSSWMACGLRHGLPPGGDFVPPGAVGVGYASPGYG
jgi:hypothetical protein